LEPVEFKNAQAEAHAVFLDSGFTALCCFASDGFLRLASETGEGPWEFKQRNLSNV
jgi:hypothetical protein